MADIFEGPKRIQRKRTKGFKLPPNTIYVGRPSKWGNPFKVGCIMNYMDILHFMDFKDVKKYFQVKGQTVNAIAKKPLDIEDSMYLYKKYKFNVTEETKKKLLTQLKGKNLACWCPMDKPCHADILLKLANK